MRTRDGETVLRLCQSRNLLTESTPLWINLFDGILVFSFPLHIIYLTGYTEGRVVCTREIGTSLPQRPPCPGVRSRKGELEGRFYVVDSLSLDQDLPSDSGLPFLWFVSNPCITETSLPVILTVLPSSPSLSTDFSLSLPVRNGDSWSSVVFVP